MFSYYKDTYYLLVRKCVCVYSAVQHAKYFSRKEERKHVDAAPALQRERERRRVPIVVHLSGDIQ